MVRISLPVLIVALGTVVAVLFNPFPVVAHAQPLSVESSTAQGQLTLDKHFLTVRPFARDRPLRITLDFGPQDRQELRHHAGFFVLDESRLRAVLGGAPPSENNLAAGSLVPNSPVYRFVATIERPEQAFTVVVFNDTTIPMTYRLTAENGVFVIETPAPGSSEAPADTQAQTAPETPGAASPEGQSARVHVVQPGESVSLIAQTIYGDPLLYDRLCTYNDIADCDRIEVGDTILLPPRARLLAGAGVPTSHPPSPTTRPIVAPPADANDETYTVASGDTLGIIAQAVYGDFQLFHPLCAYNRLADCNQIRAGQTLRIPPVERLRREAIGAPSAPPAPVQPTPTPSPTVDADLVQVIEGIDSVKVFLELWDLTGKTTLLRGEGPFTVFAPTDAAFDAILLDVADTWFTNTDALEKVLRYHVVPGRTVAADVAAGGVTVGTLEGSSLTLRRQADGSFSVNGVNVMGAPIPARNGIVYVIDAVLFPPGPE